MSSKESLSVERHYVKLSEKETEELIDILADLIVTYVKKRSVSADPESAGVPVREAARTKEGSKHG